MALRIQFLELVGYMVRPTHTLGCFGLFIIEGPYISIALNDFQIASSESISFDASSPNTRKVLMANMFVTMLVKKENGGSKSLNNLIWC